VNDDGPGIPEEHRSKIFESFVQLNDKNKSQGFGLGLAIVKRVMLLHQGTAEVTQSKFGGAKFILSWPKNKES
jgi:signal transduction histidine kinase